MTVNSILKNYNPSFAQKSAQNSSMSYYQPYYPASEYFDEYSTSDSDAAANTGIIFLAGLAIREALSKFSNDFFSKYLSKKRDIDPNEIIEISKKMIKDKGLDKKGLRCEVFEKGNDAYFSHLENKIKVTKDTLLALPHEIGHAVEEHNTKILKKLQRFRGQYAMLALILYGLGRDKSSDPNSQNTTIGKIRNFLHKYNLLVPLAAFSPELITEFSASKIGIDYLKKANASKALISAAKKHYAAAFCTYLSLPVFAIMDNLIFKSTQK